MSIETVCCENISITCFAFCLEMWNVIWEMRFRFVFCRNCLKWFVLVIMLDHLIVNIFFWSFNFIFWRMTHAHSRLSNDVCLFSICRATFMMRRQAWRSISSNLKWSDSSNLTKTTHQTWRKKRHLIKFDESVISLILTKASSHQTLKKKAILLFSDKRSHASTHDMKNLVLQNITFVRR
jgi:hypothetical protein